MPDTPDHNPTAPKTLDNPIVRHVPWNALWGVIFVLLVFFASQLVGGLVLSIYPALHHWTARHANDWINNSVNAQFVYILLAESFTIAAVYRFLRHYKLTLAAIGLRRPRWSDLGRGLLMVVPYYVIYLLTVGVVSHFVTSLNVNQQQDIGFNNVHGVLPLVITFVSLVILPPLTEEILVRGFLYSSLKKVLPGIGAVVLTSFSVCRGAFAGGRGSRTALHRCSRHFRAQSGANLPS